jgi:hypothetical protein
MALTAADRRLTDIVEKTSRMQRRSRHQTSRTVVDLCRNDEFIEVSPTANVVVATGPYQLASVPPCSAMLPLSIHQVAASSYTRRAGNIVRRVDLQQHRHKVNIRFLWHLQRARSHIPAARLSSMKEAKGGSTRCFRAAILEERHQG